MKTKIREEREMIPEAEREWAERIRAGDTAPFAAMFEAYYTRLCVYAEGYLRCPEAAREVVSETFTRLWEKRRGWVVTDSVRSYLYAAVRNRCMDDLRHGRVRATVHGRAISAARSPGLGEPPASPEDELRARELAETVNRVLDALPARAREAFLLQRRENLSYARIAEVMGISVGTVEKHMSRALAALRDAVS